MKALIIGFGSIGKRHARVLTELGHEVAVLSQRRIDHSPAFSSLHEALELWEPDYVVIANRTSEHSHSLQLLADSCFSGRILVEKPLFDSFQSVPQLKSRRIAVAYNLRFHPLLQKLRDLLQEEEIITANIYCGSYLPLWRPGTDYRKSYSSQRSEGGGVLGDLSHELDYCQWLFGSWQCLTSMGGHFSSLQIDSDDVFSIIMQTQRCRLVSVHLNYLDRVPRREVTVNTNRHTIRVDLVQNSMEIDGRKETISLSIDDTYRSEHIDMLAERSQHICSLDEALGTLLTVQAIEQAAREGSWIKL